MTVPELQEIISSAAAELERNPGNAITVQHDGDGHFAAVVTSGNWQRLQAAVLQLRQVVDAAQQHQRFTEGEK